jgi:hypothetical protein
MHAKLADLDGPNAMAKELGAEGAAKLAAKFTGLATVIENTVRTRRSELLVMGGQRSALKWEPAPVSVPMRPHQLPTDGLNPR